ncbi:EamA/RhaT family transporter [Chromobacterium phragmitis]|uniref:DMT family transporter n=1 Tax=Chromobacterium phragmitis TaxID=2202141 RepID=A0A344UIG8_9NEIS|nr:DMT family transporter [Chromobacterium phragmitis]AXE29675.1 EamA/RhaT family transporter [Chromobacterium phragmitis]AXE35066.1 EamA/RhaT family transporter [Chromobacterium phragmitis]
MTPVKQKFLATSGILTTALVWGLMWYPFRSLNAQGVSVPMASLAIYLITIAAGLALFFNLYRRQFRFEPVLVLLTLLFGWCNFSYTMAVAEGQVMRVLLLFYLSPLWTALLSRLLLHERLTRSGWGVVGLSLLGCGVFIYRPELLSGGLPLTHGYEWLALTGGMAFALGNVVSRKAQGIPVPVKSATVWFGVALIGAVSLLRSGDLHRMLEIPAESWLLLCILGVVLLCTSVISQNGVSILPASQAMTLMLMELVFAAVSAYLLAGERMSAQEWLGGALIAGASLLSGKMTHPVPRHRASPPAGA